MCDVVGIRYRRAHAHRLPPKHVVGQHEQQRVDVHAVSVGVHLKQSDLRVGPLAAVSGKKLLLGAHLHQLLVLVKLALGGIRAVLCLHERTPPEPHRWHRSGGGILEKEARSLCVTQCLPVGVVELAGVFNLAKHRQHGLHMRVVDAVAFFPSQDRHRVHLCKHVLHQALVVVHVKTFNIVSVKDVVQSLRAGAGVLGAQKRAAQHVEVRLPQLPHAAALAGGLVLEAYQDTRGVRAQRHQALKQAVVFADFLTPQQSRRARVLGKVRQPCQHVRAGPGHLRLVTAVVLGGQALTHATHGAEKGAAELETAIVKARGRVRVALILQEPHQLLTHVARLAVRRELSTRVFLERFYRRFNFWGQDIGGGLVRHGALALELGAHCHAARILLPQLLQRVQLQRSLVRVFARRVLDAVCGTLRVIAVLVVVVGLNIPVRKLILLPKVDEQGRLEGTDNAEHRVKLDLLGDIGMVRCVGYLGLDGELLLELRGAPCLFFKLRQDALPVGGP